MAVTLKEIASALGVEPLGDDGLVISGLAEPQEAGPKDLALALDPKFADALKQGQARAAVLWPGADWQALGLEGAISFASPGAAMVGLTGYMATPPDIADGIHPSAVIDPGARIGAGAAIGPFVVIGRDVVIGAGARIASHVSIGRGSRIGDNALILDGVRIMAGVRIGDNFICQPGAVLGGDGFSFKSVTGQSAAENLRASVGVSGAEGDGIKGTTHWGRVHSLGGVVIADDVEIGANSTVDRGTIRATSIGRGTKLDNLVQIGHNVEIGQDCLICAACAIAGSTRIGDRVILGGQTGVADNLFVGNDVIAGGATAVFSNVPAGRAIWGNPAVKLETQIAMNKELRRLPRRAQKRRQDGAS
ncbi:MAG TPA: UDP-3-O-(3-hydroxymyristoyl)glucosamine N-acyltransferase [Aliiroseovarius sp.]|nr:UDP-3-O-(3-hydroxymyristoyl)glucosamine N-acyltransferase [Aliiroseovarius sp.]